MSDNEGDEQNRREQSSMFLPEDSPEEKIEDSPPPSGLGAGQAREQSEVIIIDSDDDDDDDDESQYVPNNGFRLEDDEETEVETRSEGEYESVAGDDEVTGEDGEDENEDESQSEDDLNGSNYARRRTRLESKDEDDGGPPTREAYLSRVRAILRDVENLETIIKNKDQALKKKQEVILFQKRVIATLKGYITNLGHNPEHCLRGFKAPKNDDRVRAHRTWERNLRVFLARQETGEAMGLREWEKVWKAYYRENNISTILESLHPTVRLTRCLDHAQEESDIDSDDSSVENDGNRNAWHNASAAQPKHFTRTFPDHIMVEILQAALTLQGLVHFFCRVDPHVPGDNATVRAKLYVQENPSQRDAISLTADTCDPRDVLAPLAVSRKFCFWGTHIFFGSNTFAFSSLGEFGLFCSGMGIPRVQRVANLELHWAGGKALRFEDDTTSNPRVTPLSYLMECHSLQTLVIHVDESSSDVMRRPKEPQIHIKKMLAATAGQPNFRKYRALRQLQGLDYVHQLRGLLFIRVYDTNLYNVTQNRADSRVRDTSAVIDLNRTAQMKKVKSKAELARLPNLDPLFPLVPKKWRPCKRKHFKLIEPVYCNAAFDQLPANDLDVDVLPGEEPLSPQRRRRSRDDYLDLEDGDSDESDSSSESGSSDDGGGDEYGHHIMATPSTCNRQTPSQDRAHTVTDYSADHSQGDDNHNGDERPNQCSSEVGDHEKEDDEKATRLQRVHKFVQGLPRQSSFFDMPQNDLVQDDLVSSDIAQNDIAQDDIDVATNRSSSVGWCARSVGAKPGPFCSVLENALRHRSLEQRHRALHHSDDNSGDDENAVLMSSAPAVLEGRSPPQRGEGLVFTPSPSEVKSENQSVIDLTEDEDNSKVSRVSIRSIRRPSSTPGPSRASRAPTMPSIAEEPDYIPASQPSEVIDMTMSDDEDEIVISDAAPSDSFQDVSQVREEETVQDKPPQSGREVSLASSGEYMVVSDDDEDDDHVASAQSPATRPYLVPRSKQLVSAELLRRHKKIWSNLGPNSGLAIKRRSSPAENEDDDAAIPSLSQRKRRKSSTPASEISMIISEPELNVLQHLEGGRPGGPAASEPDTNQAERLETESSDGDYGLAGSEPDTNRNLRLQSSNPGGKNSRSLSEPADKPPQDFVFGAHSRWQWPENI